MQHLREVQGQAGIHAKLPPIEGTSNVCTSTYKNHALTEMHKHAIHLFKKDQSTSTIVRYMPIAEAFVQSSMDACTKEAIKFFFYIAYDR